METSKMCVWRIKDNLRNCVGSPLNGKPLVCDADRQLCNVQPDLLVFGPPTLRVQLPGTGV